MFNYNSPIVQNIFGNNGYGGYPYGYPPQTPVNQFPRYGQNGEQFINYQTPGYNPYQQNQMQQQAYNPYQQYNHQQQAYQYQQNPNYYNQQYYNSYQYEQENLIYGKQEPGGFMPNIVVADVKGNAVSMPPAYTTDYYGNPIYANPFEARQYEIEREKQYKEAMQRRINMMKSLSRCAHTANGTEIDDKTLELIYDPKPIVQPQFQPPRTAEEFKKYNDRYKMDQCSRLAYELQYKDASDQYYREAYISKQNEITEAHNKMIDKGADLVTFFDQAGKLYIESLMYEQRRRNKDCTQLYNQDNYRRALNKSVYNTDEISIPIPANLKEKYHENRERFLKAIFSQGVSANG